MQQENIFETSPGQHSGEKLYRVGGAIVSLATLFILGYVARLFIERIGYDVQLYVLLIVLWVASATAFTIGMFWSGRLRVHLTRYQPGEDPANR